MAKKPSASQLLAAHAIRHGVEDVVSALGRTEVPATLGAKPILSADSSPAAVRAVLETLGWRALVPVAKAATRSDTRIELLSSRFSSVHAAVLENPQVTAEEVEFYLTRHTGRSLGKTAAERAAELVFRHRLDHLVPRLPKRAVLEAVPYPSYSTTGQLFKGTDTTPLGSVMPGLNRLLLEAFESADPARWAGGWFTAEHTKLAAAHIHHVDGLSPDWAKKAMCAVKAEMEEKRNTNPFYPYPISFLILLRHRTDLPDAPWGRALAEFITNAKIGIVYDAGFLLEFCESAGRGTSTSINGDVLSELEKEASSSHSWSATTRETVADLAYMASHSEPYVLPPTVMRFGANLVEYCLRGLRFDPEYLLAELSTPRTGPYLTFELVEQLMRDYGPEFSSLRDMLLLSDPARFAGERPEEYLRALLSESGEGYVLRYEAAQQLAEWMKANRSTMAEILSHAPIPAVVERVCPGLPPAEELYAELLAEAAAASNPGLFASMVDTWQGSVAELRTVAAS